MVRVRAVDLNFVLWFGLRFVRVCGILYPPKSLVDFGVFLIFLGFRGTLQALRQQELAEPRVD